MTYDLLEKNMSNKTFQLFRDFIQTHIGITIADSKKIMVESRLLKRLKALNYTNYSEYADYFFSPKGQMNELARFIECITTNKTDFFREVEHFNFLSNHVLPELIEMKLHGEIRLWSGASSTGEEAYTMAMFMEEFLEKHPSNKYKILATDISEEVLDKGQKAIYSINDCYPIPINFKKKYCLMSRNRDIPTIRINKYLRKKVLFRQINLTADSYMIKKQYHVIFLRNVMIYFNKEIQSKILNNLYKHLHPEGYLFLGHSENLPNTSIPFKRVGPSIYVKKEKIINGQN
ncbi:MAG: protein-glutamate O-methyltransferase CheR [Spirochaetaceae bacterium]